MWVCATSTAGTRSVTGTNAAPLDAAAFVDLKTPPVVPIYMVLPLVSDGSTATLSTRPPAGPVAVLLRLSGARGDHGTFSAAVPVVLCAITVAAAIPSSNSRPAARSTALRSPAPRSIASPRFIPARCGSRFCLVPYCCMIPERSALSFQRITRRWRVLRRLSVAKKGIIAVTETVTLLSGDDVSHLWARLDHFIRGRQVKP